MVTVMDLEELASRVADQVYKISLYGQLTGKHAELFTVTKAMLDDARPATMGDAQYQECVSIAKENADEVVNICYRSNIEASRMKPPN
jgi:hypothetical protein